MQGGYIRIHSGTEGNATATSMPGCLPPATLPTTFIARPSPARALVAWRP
ncbi:MAG: hypothetical protein CM15mP120_02800 [Pseudomonadota bacterium]|nr:MAG: hypothetical protein CM15mP120_02800 [Pseudomonadota bacterium]